MMILETIFSLVFSSVLFITGGHLMDIKVGAIMKMVEKWLRLIK